MKLSPQERDQLQPRAIARHGRDVVREIDRRWAAGQQAGTVHPWERSRILAGEYGPIIRELEPGLEKGQKHVLSCSRPRGALVRDRVTGKEIKYPKPPPQEMFVIEIRDVVRHRAGHWRVRFHVFDRRDVVHLVRRKPPAYSLGDEDQTEVPDDEQVAIDSAYTTNPQQALDHLQAVPRVYQNVLVVQAKERWAERQAQERADDVRKRQFRALTSAIKETGADLARLGLDSTALAADIQRVLAEHQEQLSKAA